MRKYTRLPLAKRAQAFLDKKAAEVSALPSAAARSNDIAKRWKAARATKTMREGVFAVLRNMAGKRGRCMYCEDSRGTDIDHFWPKSVYPQRAFEWPNMLLSCSGCQRAKGDRFPFGDAGTPALIDPTSEDPWDHLHYVCQTGVITARYDPGTGRQSPKGILTTELLPLNDEAITEGRKRVSGRLAEAVRTFLDAVDHGFSGTSEAAAADSLLNAVREWPDYGIARWHFVAGGQSEEPYRRLQIERPELFERLGDAASQ